MSIWPRGEEAVPYLVGGAKISLDVLNKVSSLFGPSCVQAVLSAASGIIAVVEGVKANRDDSRQLVEHLLGLLPVISNSYKEETDDDLLQETRGSISRLTGVMRLAADPRTVKTFFTGAFLYVKNGQKIRDVRYIRENFDKLVVRDAGRIAAVQATGSRPKAPDVYVGLLVNGSDPDSFPIHSQLFSSSVLPAKPPVLYGRDEEVDEIAHRLGSMAESAWLALLGPRGIGKTAVLLAVMEHMEIGQKYGDCRYLVRCEQATSTTLLVELIARSLGLENSSGDRMKDVATLLLTTDHPILLLLNNFETPWDAQGEQSQVEDILCAIASCPHVSVLITMRAHAARDLFLKVHPNAKGDKSLDALLAELSCMPLAVRLMASLGRSGLTPTTLLKAWTDKAAGADLLHGTDKSKSVNISIQLSFESNIMQSVPEALTLLSVIAMLPAGASMELLSELVPSFPNLILAQARLREATLSYTPDGTQTLQLLSPICLHVLKHHPGSDDSKKALYDAYIQSIAKRNLDPEGCTFPSDSRALATEETNLEVILPDSIQDGSKQTMDAALAFSLYQYWTRPRLNGIARVVEECREKRGVNYLARGLYCYGRLLSSMLRFDEAQEVLEEACHPFQQSQQTYDRSYEADCLMRLAGIHRDQGRYDKAQSILKAASELYQKLGHRPGIANCVMYLGDISGYQHHDEEAHVSLQEALSIFRELDKRLVTDRKSSMRDEESPILPNLPVFSVHNRMAASERKVRVPDGFAEVLLTPLPWIYPRFDKLFALKDAHYSDEKSRQMESGGDVQQMSCNADDSEKDLSRIVTEHQDKTTESSGDSTPSDQYMKGFQFVMLLLGMLLSLFLCGLDQTIVATAIPKLASDFNALEQVPWVASAYLLPMPGMMLTYGQLLTVASIKWVYIAAVCLFEIGSAICGAAPSMNILIFGRALSGVGAAGIAISFMVLLARVSPIEHRAFLISLMGGVMLVSTIVGPLLGGVLTDHVTWRWCFYINLPLGAVTLLSIALLVKPQHSVPTDYTIPVWKRIIRLDWVGSVLLLGTATSVLLPLQWGGVTKSWNDKSVIACFCVFAVLLPLLIAWEHSRGENAVLPLAFFRQRTMVGCCLEGFFLQIGFAILIYYLPLYYQSSGTHSATQSGADILTYLIVAVVVSMIAGAIIGRVSGLDDISRYRQSLNLASKPLCGVIGLAAAGAIFGNRLASDIKAFAPDLSPETVSAVRQSVLAISALDAGTRQNVIKAYSNALGCVFAIGIPCMVLGSASGLLIRNLDLRKMKRTAPARKDLA
ncbi:hypothetical protein FRB97_003589 [Tulasnella sp. 331]|nr:hypothetical protein FRB97_003589 [Tulasnella sp. 331]